MRAISAGASDTPSRFFASSSTRVLSIAAAYLGRTRTWKQRPSASTVTSVPDAFQSHGAARKEPRRAYVLLGSVLVGLAPLVVVVSIATGIPTFLVGLVHTLLFGALALRQGWHSL